MLKQFLQDKQVVISSIHLDMNLINVGKLFKEMDPENNLQVYITKLLHVSHKYHFKLEFLYS